MFCFAFFFFDSDVFSSQFQSNLIGSSCNHLYFKLRRDFHHCNGWFPVSVLLKNKHWILNNCPLTKKKAIFELQPSLTIYMLGLSGYLDIFAIWFLHFESISMKQHSDKYWLQIIMLGNCWLKSPTLARQDNNCLYDYSYNVGSR